MTCKPVNLLKSRHYQAFVHHHEKTAPSTDHHPLTTLNPAMMIRCLFSTSTAAKLTVRVKVRMKPMLPVIWMEMYNNVTLSLLVTTQNIQLTNVCCTVSIDSCELDEVW